MKGILYFSLLVFLFFPSCTGHKAKHLSMANEQPTSVQEIQKDTFQKSILIPSVTLRKNPAYSFALYLPHQYGDSVKVPVLVFFDPHGDGSWPLNKYRLLSEKFGVMLVGSNDSKNGLSFEQTNAIAKTLVEEVKERFSTDSKQVSLCGFSGGAKVALVAGMNLKDNISTIIFCGAGLPAQQLSAALPPALGFAGIRDLNYTEVVETDAALEQKKISHAMITWSGKHEWPDSIAFADALFWIQFRSMDNKSKAIDQGLINEFKKQNSKVLSNSLDEWRRLEKMIAFLNGVADASEFISANESLIKKKEFLTAVQRFEDEMQTERQQKQNYYDAIGQKDLNWWKTEIERLKREKGGREAMNQRLLGYISLMCYSLSNNVIRQGEFQQAQKILSIYKMADPENPDQPYLQACLEAVNNNPQGAIEALHQAIKLGFKDKTKMMNEEAFASIKNLREFNELSR